MPELQPRGCETSLRKLMENTDCNKDNYPILNQIYDNLVELQNQVKKIILWKVLAHIGIKVSKEAKKAIDMPEMTTKSLPYTYYYQTIRKVGKK